MGLVIISKPEFTATVSLNTRQVHGDLQVTFVAFPVDELEAMERQAIEAGKGPGGVLLQVVARIEPVTTPDGAVITDVQGLLRYQGVGPQMLTRYYALLWETASGN